MLFYFIDNCVHIYLQHITMPVLCVVVKCSGRRTGFNQYLFGSAAVRLLEEAAEGPSRQHGFCRRRGGMPQRLGSRPRGSVLSKVARGPFLTSPREKTLTPRGEVVPQG
jgi:hypothetical protein